MSKPLLALSTIPTVATKEGWAGRFAKILLPFYGYWFASGAHYTFAKTTIPQDGAQITTGRQMADTYQKDCCTTCLGH